MTEREGERFDDDPAVKFVRHGDEALQIGRRTVEIIVVLIGFGIMIGTNYQQFKGFVKEMERVTRRQDDSDTKTTKASVDSQVALEMTRQQAQTTAAVTLEMDQWRGTLKAIAMIQQQGGGRVTLQIPEKPRTKEGANP